MMLNFSILFLCTSELRVGWQFACRSLESQLRASTGSHDEAEDSRHEKAQRQSKSSWKSFTRHHAIISFFCVLVECLRWHIILPAHKYRKVEETHKKVWKHQIASRRHLTTSAENVTPSGISTHLVGAFCVVATITNECALPHPTTRSAVGYNDAASSSWKFIRWQFFSDPATADLAFGLERRPLIKRNCGFFG